MGLKPRWAPTGGVFIEADDSLSVEERVLKEGAVADDDDSDLATFRL